MKPQKDWDGQVRFVRGVMTSGEGGLDGDGIGERAGFKACLCSCKEAVTTECIRINLD